MNKLKKRRKSGFTLIEMVVVIAIVVIIAAIAIPQALKAINKSKASTDIANARTYAGQIMSRAANNEIKLDASTSDADGLKKDTPVKLKDDVAKGLIGSQAADVKLLKDQNFWAVYTTDNKGNDEIIITIGASEPTKAQGATEYTGVTYPNIDPKSEYAKYVTSGGQEKGTTKTN